MVTEKYRKAYLREFENDSNTHPRSKEQYLDYYLGFHEKYCINKPQEEQVEAWLKCIGLINPASLSYKEAFSSDSPALLNDSLYQNACILHTLICSASGADHGINYRNALHALSAGLADRVALLLPFDCGMCANNHPVVVSATNLLMALWYRNEEFAEAARKKAGRTLGTKQPALNLSEIRYLLALLDGDPDEAGAQLDLYCRAVSRVQEFGAAKLKKMFWPLAHGLYNLAFFVWDKEKALSIPMPEPECFCKGFAQWQAARAFAPGKLAIEYPAPMEIANLILQVQLPKTHLHQPYLNMKEDLIAEGKDPSRYYIPGNEKQRCADGGRFRKEMIENVLKAMRQQQQA